MNTSKNLGTVELMLLAVMTLAWAVWQAVRLVMPLLALVVVLLMPRRRPAPQPAAAAPTAASDEAPAPQDAAVEATAPEPVLAPLTLATIAAELMQLPAAELRELTGCRRKVAKQRMVDAWLAMPI